MRFALLGKPLARTTRRTCPNSGVGNNGTLKIVKTPVLVHPAEAPSPSHNARLPSDGPNTPVNARQRQVLPSPSQGHPPAWQLLWPFCLAHLGHSEDGPAKLLVLSQPYRGNHGCDSGIRPARTDDGTWSRPPPQGLAWAPGVACRASRTSDGPMRVACLA